MTASAKFVKRSLPGTPQLAGAFLRGVGNST